MPSLADEVMNPILESVPVSSVKADDYDAVFLPGGHGTCWVRLFLAKMYQYVKRLGCRSAACRGGTFQVD